MIWAMLVAYVPVLIGMALQWKKDYPTHPPKPKYSYYDSLMGE